jgi:tetratricopeptide (TPR) repeat protein
MGTIGAQEFKNSAVSYVIAGTRLKTTQVKQMWPRARLSRQRSDDQLAATDERRATAKLRDGLYHYQKRQYTLAIARFLEARTIYEASGNSSSLADIARYVGAASLETQRYERASAELAKAYAYYKTRWDRRADAALCAKGLGDALIELEKYDAALFHYEAAKRLFEKERLKAEAAKCDLELGRLLKSRERNDEALAILECAVRGFIDCALDDEAAQTYQLLADINAAIGRYGASAEFERQAKRTRARSR